MNTYCLLINDFKILFLKGNNNNNNKKISISCIYNIYVAFLGGLLLVVINFYSIALKKIFNI